MNHDFWILFFATLVSYGVFYLLSYFVTHWTESWKKSKKDL